jgi:cell division protein FtsA
MEVSSNIVAIDLGTTKIVTIVGRKNATGYIHILDFQETPSQGIKYGEVKNILSVVNILRAQLNDIQIKLNIRINEVFVGIAGQNVRNIDGSTSLARDRYDVEISENELQKLENDILRIGVFPEEKIMQAVVKTYSIDGENDIINPVGRLGHSLTGHFHLVIVKKDSIHHTKLCMQKLDLQMNELILEPIASAMAVLSEEEKEAGVVMVDMGGGTTDMVVYVDNTIQHTAVIPFGGNIITSDIRYGLDILTEEAERIKKEYGACVASMMPNDKYFTIHGIGNRESMRVSMQQLALIIEARICEIINAVVMNIEPYKHKLRAGIVFTGGGAQIKYLKEYVRLRTGMYVEIGKPNKISSESPKNIIHPRFSTVIGLLMCATQTNTTHTVVENSNIGTAPNKPAAQNKTDQDKPETPNTVKTGINSMVGALKNIFIVPDTDDV